LRICNVSRFSLYTTNAIEGFNRQLRKVTKSKTVFPSDDSLLKMLYLATMDITKKMDRSQAGLGTNPFPA
jgi:transposase-like protein